MKTTLLLLLMMISVVTTRGFWTVAVRRRSRWSTTTRFFVASSSSKDPTTSSSNNSKLGKEQQVLMQQQKQVSDAIHHNNATTTVVDDTTTTTTKEQPKSIFKTQFSFLKHQQRVFDEMATTFATGELVPPELHPVYQRLAQQCLLPTNTTTTPYRILDVACGTGVLWPFLTEQATTTKTTLEITGIDLSPNMIEYASQRADELFEHYLYTHTKHSFAVLQTDVLEYQPTNANTYYDCIIINASFGNFWNPKLVLEHLSNMLVATTTTTDNGGQIVISHPLGAEFVTQLHQQDSSVVPHTLPTREQWLYDMLLTLPFQLREYIEEVEVVNDDDDENDNTQKTTTTTTTTTTKKTMPCYCAILQKVRARSLPDVWRFRGSVATGYGRGGKKLGFPTANLPSHLFQTALQDVRPGVYFGYAVIEQEQQPNEPLDNLSSSLDTTTTTTTTGRNTIHKAVVNVGYSPTFQGQENPEKIIEAHLLLEETIPDFYGATLRLQLLGFLRPEQKFPSFADLIAQIHADAHEANTTLDQEPYTCFRMDPFLQSATTDVETTGSGWLLSSGDGTAGWEIEDIRTVLQNVRNS